MVAQKNATPTKEQKESISKCGLQPVMWVVVKELHHSMIIRNRVTSEFKMIEK